MMKNGTRIAFAVDPTGYKIELIERPSWPERHALQHAAAGRGLAGPARSVA
jgi:hypothetical protein